MVQRRRSQAASRGANLPARVERALREHRFPQALELAKTLFHQQATPEHRDLLRRAYLARGRELRERGATHDALTLFQEAARSAGDDPAWLVQVAEQIARGGAIAEALAFLDRLDDPAAQDRLRGHVADAALEKGTAGRALLPEAFQADFDRVAQAFALSESSQDDAARAALGGIGLRSPFLEWKVLLRGLLAYYAGDDVRALENWQRLSPDRLPYRLAAPLRQRLDAPFRAAQPPETQTLLIEQFDRLQGAPLLTQLRGLRAALANKENLAPAFRQAEALLPELRRQAPALVDRLSRILYWSIIESGPDDVPRYQRVFGRPPLDPQFNRLQAIAHERILDFAGAHKNWQKYEKEIAADAAHWPPGQAERARALVWMHLGENAESVPPPEAFDRLPPFLFDAPPRPKPLKPTAEECYQRACELAPDLLDPHVALFEFYRKADKEKKAVAAGQRLLKHFPEHAPTLEHLADLLGQEDRHDEALALYKRALQVNPLDRDLREKTAAAHLGCARLFAVAKDFDAARRELQAVLAMAGGTPGFTFFCRSAGVELKAGTDPEQVEAILQQARHKMGSAAGIAYLMLVEAIRLKLPKPVKTRFEGEFNAALTGPPSGVDAVHLALAADALDEGPPYLGQKTHQKKVLAYLDRIRSATFTDGELQAIVGALLDLGSIRLARQYVHRGAKDFPKSPFFPYLEAVSYFRDKNPDRMPVWKVDELLRKAERLAKNQPPTPALQTMLADAAEKKKALAAVNPFFSGMMGNPFGDAFGPLFEADEDGYDDYED